MTHFATIVLGGGTMGTAAAWQLGLRGEKALVLEQFGHVHAYGAHGGQTRVFRHAYAEHPDYVPFVLRADELWMQLEAECGRLLLHRCGALELSTGAGSEHAERARASAIEHGIEFEWLDASEIRRRWPQFQVRDHWQAGFGPRSGFLEVEPSLHAMGALARAHGVEIHEHEAVERWGASSHGVWVQTATGRYSGDRLIITAGPWAWKVLAPVGIAHHVLRKTLFWMELAEPDQFTPERFPVFMGDRDTRTALYGFPVFGQPGLKYANHAGGDPTDPDTINRATSDAEAADLLDAGRWFFGHDAFTGQCLKSAVCMYAMTPDGHFIIDRLPEMPNVVIGAGFSGHGFKFTPAVGEHLVDLAYNALARPYDILSLARFAGTTV